MNTHVAALLEAEKQPGVCAAPRVGTGQAAGRCLTTPLSGISGFAFQGTNAHALLQVSKHSCICIPVSALDYLSVYTACQSTSVYTLATPPLQSRWHSRDKGSAVSVIGVPRLGSKGIDNDPTPTRSRAGEGAIHE